jgi:hypothetical protein
VIPGSRAWCGALALALLIPAGAAAQAPRNPFAELFGRAPQRTGREFTAVQFRMDTGAQWGQTVEAVSLPVETVPDGLAGAADASLIGDFVRDRIQARGLAHYRYQAFRQDPVFGAPAFDGGGDVNVELTTRLSLQGGGQYARSPYYSMVWLASAPPGPIAPPVRAPILLMENETLEGSAGITSNYTRRSSLSLTGFVRETRFDALPQNDFRARGARALWKHQMSRDLALRAGYGREELRQRPQGVETRLVNELIDLGVEYARGLSLARRTTLSFGTETSMIQEAAGFRHFRVNGHFLLERQFKRSWLTQLSAHRATEFLPGFTAPVFTERAQASLNGYLAKRLLLNVNAAGGQGEVGFNDPRKFVSYTGDARLTLALTRRVGLFTQYFYSHYQSPADPENLFVVPRLARQSVSVGVQTWFSLIDKEKVTSDTR